MTEKAEERTTCMYPSCDRPRHKEDGRVPVCQLHRDMWEAGATLGEWQCAREILEPMVKTSEAIGGLAHKLQ